MSLRSVPGIKCVVTDLDDTFWDSTMIPDQNSRVAAALQRLHIPLIPATGRSRCAVRRKLDGLQATPFHLAPGVFNDGALVYGYDPNKPLHCICLSEDLIDSLSSLAEKLRVSVGWTTPQGLWGLNGADWMHGDYTTWDERIFRVDSVKEIPAQQRCSAFFCGPDYKVMHDAISTHPVLAGRVERVLYDRFECAVVKSKGADKVHAVKTLAGHMGWDISEVLVIGDGRNDVQMLRGFPVSLAMINGHNDARRVAAMISDLSVSEGGWGHAIRKVLEIDAEHIDNL